MRCLIFRICFQLSVNQHFLLPDKVDMASLWLFSSTLAMFCQIIKLTEALQCGSEGSISGWMLQKHIYKTIHVDKGINCVQICQNDNRCQSLNFAMRLRICELNDRTKEARPEDFVPNPNRHYFKRYIKRGEWKQDNQMIRLFFPVNPRTEGKPHSQIQRQVVNESHMNPKPGFKIKKKCPREKSQS